MQVIRRYPVEVNELSEAAKTNGQATTHEPSF